MEYNRVAVELSEKRLPLSVLSLAWPVVLQEAAWAVLAMLIILFVGHLGAEAVTAVALSEHIIYIPWMVFAGVSVGATAIVARYTGARESRQANHTLGQAMILAFAFGIAFGLILWFSADQLLWLFRARPEVIVLGRGYIQANAVALVFYYFLNCGAALLRGAGDTRTPMVVIIVAEAFGAGLAYFLINGFWFVPALGVLGAGLARAISSVLGALIIMVILARGKSALKYDFRASLAFDAAEIKRILKVGLPALAEQLQMRGAMSLYTIIISSLGTTVYAAHAIAMRVEEFAFVPSFAFGIAATTMIGQALGAGKPDLAKRAGYLIQRYCVATMVTLGIITLIFSRQLIAIFIDDPEVIAIGATGLRIWAFAMPGMATNLSLAGGLRGAGDTRWVFLLTTIGMWTMRVGSGALMVFVLHLGAPGAWLGAVLDHSVRAGLIWWRFASGKWQSLAV